MADRQMNQFTAVTDGAYIYAEASDGSQVKIPKSDLVEIFRNQITLKFNSWSELEEYANSQPYYSIIPFTSPFKAFDGEGFYGNLVGGFMMKNLSDYIIIFTWAIDGTLSYRLRSNGQWNDPKIIYKPQ